MADDKDRCKRCDQEQCPAPYPSACENDAVDWRARALAAEAVTAEFDQRGCDLVAALLERDEARQIAAGRLDSILRVGDNDGECLCDYFNKVCPYCVATIERDGARAQVESLRAQLEEWRVDNEKQRAAKVALEIELKLVQEALGNSDAREAELERDLRAEFEVTEAKLRTALEKAGAALSACHAEIGAWLAHNGLLKQVYEASEAVRDVLDTVPAPHDSARILAGKSRGRKIEKRPGQDWIVTVRVPGEDELYPVSVFGAATQALAVADALAGFKVTVADPKGHEVISVEKLGG